MAKKLHTTPKGTAIYPWLQKADDKFGDPTYKVDLESDDIDGVDKFTAKLQDIYNEFLEEVTEEKEGDYDEIVEEEMPWFDGDNGTVIRAKLNKFGKNKRTGEEWENKIAFYDAKGHGVDKSALPVIGGGSVLRLSVEPNLWTIPDSEGRGKNKKTFLKVGLSLRIKAVQVIEAKQQRNAATAESMGFEEEEGYEYNPDTFDAEDAGDDDDML